MRDFQQSYEAVAIPAPIRSMDAIDERVVAAEEHFLQEVSDSLQLSKLALSTFCSIRHRMLVPLDYQHSQARSVRASDDILSELWFSDVQPLATVMKVRDGHNWQVANFSKYPLLPHTVSVITNIEAIDDVIDPNRHLRFNPSLDL